MLHTQLHGTHWQIGFQLGAGLARDGHFILDAVPFPITPARLEFARTCLPSAAGGSPPPWRSCGAGPGGRGVPQTNWPGSSSPCTPCRPAPAAPALPCAGERGPVRPEQRLSHGAGRAQRQLPIPFSDGGYSFVGNTTSFLQMEDGVNQFGLAADSPRCPQPTLPRAECWSDPAAPAGILPGCSQALALLRQLPSPPATRWCWPTGLGVSPGGVCPRAHPDPLSRGDGRLRLLRQFLPPLRHGPLPPADGRRLAGGRALSDPHPLPGRLGPGARPPSWTGPALRQDGLPMPV